MSRECGKCGREEGHESDCSSLLYNQKKHDNGKLLFSCVTRGFAKPLQELAKVMSYGAKKYARDSWQTVPDAKIRYEDALMRHLNAWSCGEVNDEESSLPHLAHAAANIMFLLHFELEKKND